eukprot:TRINITY_DN7781_c2_g1_i3.p1 TRINITY_DN7781_c2_g1~~TRINITY_DN7781_c2_g1_i3.p1  ORF type:complete len:260 (+),score=99.23 TRINITY_DN7781_c2_g1_i3:168-947(+)
MVEVEEIEEEAVTEHGAAPQEPEGEKAADASSSKAPAEPAENGAVEGDAGGNGEAVPAQKKGKPLEERLKSAVEDREKGMRAFEKGDWQGAIDGWAFSRGSLKYVIDQGYLKDEPEALAKVVADQHKMHLNLAQAFLNKGEWRQAIEYAGRALNNDPEDVKALYRTAMARKGLSEYNEARELLARLQKVQPDHAASKQLLQEMEREEKLAQKTAKKSASKIFDGMARDHDYRVEPPASSGGGGLLDWLRCSFCRKRKAA